MNFPLNQVLTLWEKNGLNDNGESMFLSGVEVSGVRIEEKEIKFKNQEGQERIGSAIIYSAIDGIKIGDRVFLGPILDVVGTAFTAPSTRTIAARNSSPCVKGRQKLFKFIAE